MEWHLDQPPFPPLAANDDDEYFWFADGVRLPALWPEPTRLVVQTDHTVSGEPGPPSAGQRAAFAELTTVGPAAVAAVVAGLRRCGPKYAAATESELLARLRLLAVHVGEVERDGVAYFVLECVHDEDEHPFGAVLHRGRLVRIAAADDAITFDAAAGDAEPGAAADGAAR